MSKRILQCMYLCILSFFGREMPSIQGSRVQRCLYTANSGQSKQQRLQVAFAAHLRDIASAYPASQYPEVVITIDKAPWHRGALMAQVLAAHPHLRLKRLPSYSPQLNVIERFWRVL